MPKKQSKSISAPKITNTFAGYQKARVEGRGVKLDQELAKLAKSKAVFSHLTYLARHLATALSNEEDGNCAPSTLLRNPAYKAKMIDHLRHQAGDTAKLPKSRDLDDLGMQIELSNLRAEVARLKAYIGANPGQPTSAPNKDIAVLQRQLSSCQERLDQSNKALHAILANTKGLIDLDPATGNIIDRSKKINNVVFVLRA